MVPAFVCRQCAHSATVLYYLPDAASKLSPTPDECKGAEFKSCIKWFYSYVGCWVQLLCPLPYQMDVIPVIQYESRRLWKDDYQEIVPRKKKKENGTFSKKENGILGPSDGCFMLIKPNMRGWGSRQRLFGQQLDEPRFR